MKVIPITDFYSRGKIEFAYKQRLKYTDEVYWIEEDGLFAVAIPAKEWKAIEGPKSKYKDIKEYEVANERD